MILKSKILMQINPIPIPVIIKLNIVQKIILDFLFFKQKTKLSNINKIITFIPITPIKLKNIPIKKSPVLIIANEQTNNITKVKQLSKEELCNFCIETGVPSTRISQDNVEEFYAIRLFTDQLYGMFAETILLVEGQTEFFAIPEYLKRLGFSLPLVILGLANPLGATSLHNHASAGGRTWKRPAIP